MTTTANYSQEYNAICELFKTAWDAVHPEIPVAWENVKFDANNKASFLEFFVKNGESNQVSVGIPGSNRFRHVGVVMTVLHVDQGMGKASALAVADDLAAIFRRSETGSVSFLDPAVNFLGNEGAWLKVSVTCGFYRDSFF
jgi:hypothetical protein